MLSAERVLADYEAWLERQALAPRTRTVPSLVRELIDHLAAGDELAGFLVHRPLHAASDAEGNARVSGR